LYVTASEPIPDTGYHPGQRRIGFNSPMGKKVRSLLYSERIWNAAAVLVVSSPTFKQFPIESNSSDNVTVNILSNFLV
jgi:hypothetical protein